MNNASYPCCVVPIIIPFFIILLFQTANAQCAFVCNDNAQISLPASCSYSVQPEEVLEGGYLINCPNGDFLVEMLVGSDWIPAILDESHIGQSIQSRVRDQISGVTCFSELNVLSGSCNSPSCPYNITFLTQSEIDDYAATYPGCTSISGNVTIEGIGITNLNGLSILTSIGGNLSIAYNSSLTSLTGLDALTSVGGSFNISYNETLTSLTGLESLTSVGGDLYISYNASLTDLTGLNALASIEGSFYIWEGNAALTSLTGLNALNSVDGVFSIISNTALSSLTGLEALTSAGLINISNNPALTSLTGLEALTSTGEMVINGNNTLTSVSGLNHPISITGNLTIQNNGLLSNCVAQGICDYLSNPSGYIDIQNNAIGCNYPEVYANCNLTSPPCPPNNNLVFATQTQIDNFQINSPGCESISGNVTIEGSGITNLNGLSILTSIGGNLSIAYNSSLTSLTGLDALTFVGGSFNISYNETLTSLSGLESLTSVGGDLYISYDASLTDLTGLNALASIEGSFYIWEGNAALTSLTGLNALNSVDGVFSIISNTALTTLTGLEALTSAGVINILNNPALTSLTGLEALTSTGEIVINGNSALTSVIGLNHPISITGNLTIQNNGLLSNCVAQSICDYLSNPPGIITIDQNGLNCNTTAQVAAACENPVICPGNITFITQAEIDAFPTTYPECSTITGDITIQGTDITNLNGLAQVTSIAGTLGIYYNDVLMNLTGLDALISVGSLWISSNNSLTSLSGLGNLETIEGSLQIVNNSSLTSLVGLEALTSIEGLLYIGSNSSLMNLAGLDALTTIGGYLDIQANSLTNFLGLGSLTSIGGFVHIYNNLITSFSGLSGLISIGGDFNIQGNPNLTSLTGLNSLISIGGNLVIYQNNALLNLSGLDGLTSTNGLLFIENNASLISLVGLDNIDPATITDLTIQSSNQLSLCNVQSICEYLSNPANPATISGNATGCATRTEIEAACAAPSCPSGDITFSTQAEIDAFPATYPGCTTITGNVSISGSDIVNLSGLSAVTSIGGSLSITYNSLLTSLNGLDAVTSIGGGLSITSNPTLTSLTGLGAVPSIGGYLYIQDNPALTNLEGLGAVTSIEGNLIIYSNTTLTSLTGLDAVTSIGSTLSIGANAALTSLEGLGAITSIGGGLFIGANAVLTSLMGLGAVTSIVYLQINNNAVLTSLSGLSSVTLITGWVDISDNAALMSLTGLENITPTTITDLTIQNSNMLSWCNVQSICDYLSNPANPATISGNATGCATRAEIEAACTNPSCPPGDITFTTQAEIDAFPAMYPGCTTISGNVTIQGSDITNLNGLSAVTSIGEGLYIQSNQALTSLSGLSAVTSIGEGLYIYANPALTSLTGLDNIDPTTITDLTIQSSNQLSLCDVQSICDYLSNPANPATISANATGCATRTEVEAACACPGDITFTTQAEIDAFPTDYPGCTEILGNVTIDDGGSENITNLNGLSQLSSVGGNLTIQNNSSLTSLTGLDALNSVEGNFYIDNNATLISLTGLEAISYIGGIYTQISNNAALTSLTGLSGLTSLEEYLFISNNDALTSLTGLNALTFIGGVFSINENPALSSLTGLDALNSIGQHLTIFDNAVLTDLSGLDALTSIGGHLIISNNDALTNLTGLNALNSIGENFGIFFNATLTSLTGLDALTSIGNFTNIFDNAALESLTGLNALTSIGGGLDIGNNPALTNLMGLGSLTSSGGDINIFNNASLISLTGLENINPTTITDLTIQSSNQLSLCDVQSICDYLAIPSNPATISGNATGCATRAEIEAACTAPSCPPGDITFTSQAEIDAFPTMYPGCTTITGNLTIQGSDIINLNGLSSITSIEGDINITNNSPLTSLSGLDAVNSIGGNLNIYSNPTLTNLSGLDAVTSVGGELRIQENWILTNVNALNAVTNIMGDLVIEGNPQLTSLTGLNALVSIGGGLHILNYSAFTSLNGLNAVTTIGGWLNINGSNLLNLTGLDAVISIGETVLIANNANLLSLTGLNSVISIGGDIYIENNSNLTSLGALSTVTSIGGELLYLQNNAALSTCEVQSICNFLSISPNNANIYGNAQGCASVAQVQIACGITITCPNNITFTTQAEINNFPSIYPGCTTITGNVTIQGSDITNLNGLSSITSIGGGLDIEGNSNLTSLSGLDAVTSIGANIYISGNSTLTSLSGLDAVTSIGAGFAILYNGALTTLTELNNLISIGGDFDIVGNDALISLSGLGSITFFPGNFNIINNSSLSICNVQSICDYLSNPTNPATISGNATGCATRNEVEAACTTPNCPASDIIFTSQAEIDAFPTTYLGCTQVSGGVTIDDDVVGNITNLNGLNQLTNISGYLYIGSNAALTSLTGLDAISSIGSDLHIESNTALTSLSGLNNVISIGGSLDISGNSTLESLSGLDALTSIEGSLIISNNPALTSLSGLDAVTYIGGELIIDGNNSLSICEVQSVCDYISDQANPATISGNAAGCASRVEVETACAGCVPVLIVNQPQDQNATVGGTATFSVTVDGTGPYIYLWYKNGTLIQGATSSSYTTPMILSTAVNGNMYYCAISNCGGSNQVVSNSVVLNVTDLPSCLQGAITFSSQAQIDAFPINYPGCAQILGNVIIDDAITGNITNLNGLAQIEFIRGSLEIKNNAALTSLIGLNSLTTIIGIDGGGFLNIFNNPSLMNLEGLNALSNIGYESPSFPGIFFPGQLGIGGNSSLINLEGLDALAVVGSLTIGNNFSLTSLEGINAITHLQQLTIQNNAALTSLEGLEAITQISVGLYIYYNPSLLNLTGLNGLVSVDLELQIAGNPVLTSLEGLNALTHLEGLRIQDNPVLSNISALNSISQIDGFSPHLDIVNNDGLINLEGLNALTTIGGLIHGQGSLAIAGNDALVSLEGLNALISIDGGLNISTNTALTDLTGLNSLTSLGGAYGTGTLSIINNDALTSLAGLDNLNSTTISSLNIQSSQNLSLCNVPSICSYLSIPNNPAIISGNASGCNNRIEVEVACGTYPECPLGDITFSNQSQIDNFALNYQGCDHILGNVTIDDVIDGNITNLTGLAQINVIEGSLQISNNSGLLSLNGLNAITFLRGDLNISGNSSLTSLTGLNSLTTISGGVSANVIINNNASLSSLNGLNSLATINYYYNYNQSVIEKGSVQISNNAVLTNLSGLEGLTNISGLTIDGNSNLISLSGLNPLVNIVEITISNNANLINLDGFTGNITDDININYNPALTSLSGFDNISFISGNLSIGFNNSLSSLLGLSSLTDVYGSVDIEGNNILSNLLGLNSLNNVSGSVQIANNNGLTSLLGLEALNSIGDLIINHNNSLSSLTGINALYSINGLLSVTYNNALSSLSGLSSVAYIGNSLIIENNDGLVSLSGLDNIDLSYITNLSIQGSNQLTTCGIQSICEYLSEPLNPASISNNATGCSSRIEVEAICTGCIAPTINSQPQDQIAVVGSIATFNVVASGTSPLSYQWKKNGVNIVGANNATYITPILALSDNNNIYSCVVSNCNGSYSVVSNTAILTVTTNTCLPVSIAIQPQNQTAVVGSTATFSITVNGSNQFYYTWYRNGSQTAVSNSSLNTDSYTTPALTPSDNGNTYYCVVNNCNFTNQVISNTVTLTVTSGCTTPTIQASNISFSSIGAYQMTVNCANGNGTKRIVKINTSNSFSNPANGTDPNAFPIYTGIGVEQVVYNGEGNTFEVYGLHPNTTYWFRAYEANCTGSNSKYNNTIASNNPQSQTTLSAPDPSWTGIYLNDLNHPFLGPELLLESADITQSSPNAVNICADGSKATVIKYVNHDPSILLSNIRFEINSGSNVDLNGFFYLADYSYHLDTVIARFTHPKYVLPTYFNSFRTDWIDIVNNANNSLIYQYPIKIFRAPVVFVHGLWGNMTTFEEMSNAFISGVPLMKSIDYPYTNGASFFTNRNVVKLGIDDVLYQARSQKFSAGKVIIIGHSMGGVLARLYLQSTYVPFYRYDILKLITLNTPHYGTQSANYLWSHPSLIQPLNDIFTYFGNGFVNNGDYHAIEDLQVNSFATTNNLNIPLSLQNIVASTTIHTDWTGTSQTMFAEAVSTIISQDLFNGDINDLIVPNTSQDANLNLFNTFQGQMHLGSASNSTIINGCLSLLDENPNDDIYFTNNGFPPFTIPPPSIVNPTGDGSVYYRNTDDSISIINPLSGEQFNAGDSVTVNLSVSGNLSRIALIIYGNSIDPITVDTTNISNIKFIIPQTAVGVLHLLALGGDSLDWYVDDTIQIIVNSTIIPDSLHITPGSINLPIGLSHSLSVSGYFNGTQINLIGAPGLSSIFDSNIVHQVSPGIFQGINTGETDVIFLYQGLTDTAHITVYNDPSALTASFNFSSNEVCANSTVQFTNASIGIPVGFEWVFPGGNPSTSTETNPVVTYSTPGYYAVGIKTYFTNGVDSVTLNGVIHVNSLPTATIIPSGSTTLCQGDSVTLTTGQANSISWNNGSIEQSITVSGGGEYSVIVTNENGCTSSSSLLVTSIPLPTVTVNDPEICEGLSTTLAATGGTDYLWSDGLGNTSSVTTPLLSDTMAYTVTVTNGNCIATAQATVNVNSITADAGADQSICSGESTSLIASGGTDYQWSDGLGNTNSVMTPALSGSTTYSVTVTSGSCTATDQVTVNVGSITADAGANQSICIGETATLTASGGTDYLWSDGLGNTNSVTTPTLTGSTTYTVTVTGGNCTATDQVTVNVGNIVADAGADQNICNGETATLTASGGTDYLWSDGLGNTNSVTTPILADTTTYTVTVTSGNCTATDQVVVNVESIIADAGADQSICTGETVILTATGGIDYQWSDGLGNTASVTTPPLTESTNYTVTVANGNCNATDQVAIDVQTVPIAGFGYSINQNVVTFQDESLNANNYLWNLGDDIISSLQEPVHTYLNPGTYTVIQIVTNICGSDTLEQVIELLVGVIDPGFLSSIKFYPNPGNGLFYLSLTGPPAQSMEVRLYDLIGRELFVENYGFEIGMLEQVLDFRGLPSATYFLRLMSEGKMGYLKVVVER